MEEDMLKLKEEKMPSNQHPKHNCRYSHRINKPLQHLRQILRSKDHERGVMKRDFQKISQSLAKKLVSHPIKGLINLGMIPQSFTLMYKARTISVLMEVKRSWRIKTMKLQSPSILSKSL